MPRTTQCQATASTAGGTAATAQRHAAHQGAPNGPPDPRRIHYLQRHHQLPARAPAAPPATSKPPKHQKTPAQASGRAGRAARRPAGPRRIAPPLHPQLEESTPHQGTKREVAPPTPTDQTNQTNLAFITNTAPAAPPQGTEGRQQRPGSAPGRPGSRRHQLGISGTPAGSAVRAAQARRTGKGSRPEGATGSNNAAKCQVPHLYRLPTHDPRKISDSAYCNPHTNSPLISALRSAEGPRHPDRRIEAATTVAKPKNAEATLPADTNQKGPTP